MGYAPSKLIVLVGTGLMALAIQAAFAATEDLGNGFFHHGIATPVSNHRGTVATVDGEGRDVVLVWLFDHRGGYALLMIDAETGRSEEFPMPFPPGGDCPYASILSSGNKFYTHFNSHFVEFDPAKRAFTFFRQTAPQMAMGMTEDDNGVIWSVTYPNSGVVSFDPATRAFKDYGHVHQENWAQYQRYVAADDAGWIYFGIGETASQIIAFDPRGGEAKPMIPQAERVKGSGSVYRDMNGRVYGHSGSGAKDDWYEFHHGEGKKIVAPERIEKKPIITSSQGLFRREFPDGKLLKTCDLVNRVMVVENPKTGEVKELHFDYTSEGAHIMGLAAAPDGTICGGTAFPMRFFSYNPQTDEWINRESYGQWNTVARQGDRFFVGGYGGGFLLEWDPSREWVPTEKGKRECNPLFLTECEPAINRPHELLAHPDGKTLVLAGTPGYGYTGGGLLLWDRETQTRALIEHTDILPEQSTMSLVALPSGKLLGGTTTSPGTGGEKKAEQAELYIMDLATKRLEWHQAVFPGAQGYTDLCRAPNGLVYGVADRERFFVFDPTTREVVYEEDTEARLGPTNSQQGPRVFVLSPDGKLYMLFVKGIARVDLATHGITMLAESPVPIGPGGDLLNGRIYFGSGSHVYSYQVPARGAD
jgi:streptogramin lyase